ncbi:MAG: alpha/beta fold hydrolase [Rhizobiales bacterium]|nr:alpha/beta fold hydrolase [Hyphomicrobiales bacterium]MBO6697885.1 alpha/beta fold hydrolase [Hyphomicrobiales bacterium]MBO6735861.1 alpha/beta fold hydrolase [Hyphomicrobiales bacterium]MBO6913872.1 alpha/beta fold hydrolase [Hyphomicrobiales bacterium]MBO6955575.1 alpha/beta fold hydrolase [Hyphomicrobiales bacterium]
MIDPIVFLPGLQSDHRSWVYQIAHFQNRHPVIVAEGFHNQDSLAGMARIILPQLPERFHLVAWSMGGYVAFQLLPEIADRLLSLALIATSARADSAQSTRNRHRQIEVARRKGIGFLNRANQALNCVDASLLDTPPFRAMTDAAVEIGLEAYEKQQKAIIAREDATDRLALITCPTVVIVGDADTTTPPEEARIIHNTIAGSTFHEIPASGHSVPLEKPTQVNQLIDAVIAQGK